ncbi:PQQ-dependent catabolism-associated CXXCW motif protein [Pseudomonas sp. AN-1]|uniref:PQQ-dependent catabolism-associated CXXCW motif protein n=1 Tax=Pseudomonas sp. AN-1 TaxID=3096605 RepID=UPI002A6A1AA7|nr:PQQ-dependent catabolism-associated CXXCW motif protein [Pseudomonas sp. AN-1]WPP45281.1 PQQ-dependent catabolism-associated CXXCW motif protein [Pseudomonas sp. AN-1]
MSRLLAAMLCLPLLLGLLPAQAGEEALFSTDGYRLDRYRSPTPASVKGAQTIDTATLQQLLASDQPPVLIDVFRRPWLHGRFASDEPHHNIPGSLWLANVGEGRPEAQWLDYFAHYLERASGGDRARPLVLYCKSDCWLSWNASRRAAALGYTRLYWYRDGIDAWQQAGLPVQAATPEPLP